MGYDQDLEDRIDRLTDGMGEITRRKTFGGIGYLINGNMCFAIHKEPLVVRISPDKAEELMRSKYVTSFDITGKPMKGWVLVSPDIFETDEHPMDMLRLGVSFAETLPKK